MNPVCAPRRSRFAPFAGLLLGVWTGLAGAEARLEVSVTPRSSALRSNIEGHIGALGERDAAALERYRRSAEAQARRAAEALGYYRAHIRSHVEAGDPPTLHLEVERGEPVRLRQVEIRVEGPAAQQSDFRVPEDIALKPGERLDHGRYEAAKRSIATQAARFGYFQGRFVRHRLDIDPNAGHADIELVYASGPRYRFGETTFEGELLDEELLARMQPFREGAAYDAELIAEFYQSLQGSGYFGSVRIDAEPSGAVDDVIPVVVHLGLREPRSLGLGLGFSTDVGPRGRATWTRHWANEHGHRYGAEAELSAPRQNVGLWYEVPGDKPLTDKLRYAGGYQYEEIADTDSRSRLLRLGPEWHSLRPSGWQRVISLKWQHEDYRLGDDTGLSTLLLPGVAYDYLSSDDRLDPSRGYRLRWELSAAKEGLFSDADVLHVQASAKGLITLFERHRLLGRAQFGGTFTNEYKAVPPSLRFFAGGDQSVRGYDYQSLSPRNERGDRIGGRYLVAAGLEYQYNLFEKWRLATFVDQGNAFRDFELPSLKTGVGVGLRWVSPVGPLRLDLARGLDDGGGFRIHFSMGPEL